MNKHNSTEFEQRKFSSFLFESVLKAQNNTEISSIFVIAQHKAFHHTLVHVFTETTNKAESASSPSPIEKDLDMSDSTDDSDGECKHQGGGNRVPAELVNKIKK